MTLQLKALNRTTTNKSRCPGLVFRPGAPSGTDNGKPHICCYIKDNLDLVDRLPALSRVDLGYLDMFIQVYPHPSDDFFADPPLDESSDSAPEGWEFMAAYGDKDQKKLRRRAHGQHISLVHEVLARQHRRCLYTAILCGHNIRLLRWERGGCVVTQSLDISTAAEGFCTFLWHFSHASPARRGFDTSVGWASQEAETVFRTAITDHVAAQLQVEGEDLVKAVSEHYEPGNVKILTVLGYRLPSLPVNIHNYIVSRPVITPTHLRTRGTRGYWAIDVDTLDVVFVKDTWWFHGNDGPEGNLIERLNRAGVDFVPSFVWHGVVPTTSTEDGRIYEGEHSGPRRVSLSRQVHYRLVVGTVGYGIQRFSGTSELLHATYDVFHAMIQALAKVSMLHRDISVGNIIIVRENAQPLRRGYLIDWDASLPADEEGNVKWLINVAFRFKGTYMFASRQLAAIGDSSHSRLQDDMESLLYVILYCAFLWLPHTAPEERLKTSVYMMFERDCAERGIANGAAKLSNAVSRIHTSGFDWPPLFREWLDEALGYNGPQHQERYQDKWDDPVHLDTYWGNFLKSHESDLPVDDRTEHDNSRVAGVEDPSRKRPRESPSSSREGSAPPPKDQALRISPAPPPPEDDGPAGDATENIDPPLAIPADTSKPIRRSIRLLNKLRMATNSVGEAATLVRNNSGRPQRRGEVLGVIRRVVQHNSGVLSCSSVLICIRSSSNTRIIE
ncbi:uncharacterized protein BXZ73DRAFT_40721 [Epithele typhae]|uniref:uncharacterized protein n=1 Tax=Epithele typhae TaxID=378194 RepID=UPI002008839B|nr:uncharacterized protein BXZ73DRAFT_40721 [Epithele typhae]KAH9943169.1 hypothetical protein BXZ73DRAFT_40721 [Epithele typhae]